MSPLELTGVLFGLLTVYFSVKQNIWTWPTGIVSVTAFAFLFFEVKLYADMCLQLFFLWSCVQGWYFWLHGGANRTELKITQLTTRQRIVILLGVVACVLLIGFLFSTFTDAALPYLDSTASGMSVVAQLLMMRKKLEHWYLWITVDILSVGIYIYKDIPLTAGLYFIFLVLCIKGLIEWRKELASFLPSTAVTFDSLDIKSF
ncbi:MAG: nicotinamide mononucleotide transporter [Ignavibacteriae bacterium]|nr:nicotinamide mononucleotide transporter [Ignavibacteriota bacterium]